MSTLQEVVNSPKLNRYLPWAAAAILLIGVAVFLGVKYSNTAKSTATPVSNQPAVQAPAVKHVPLSKGARSVAAQFLEKAVSRKDAVAAYRLSGPSIRQGETLAAWKRDWKTVGVPIVPFQALPLAQMSIDYSLPNEAMVEFVLVPKSGGKTQVFQMVLVKQRGRWFVDSWVPRTPSPVHVNPQN